MGSELDMSLDDIIKHKKETSGRGRGRGGRGSRGRGTGPIRRSGGRGTLRSSPYALAQSAAVMSNGFWQQDLFSAGAANTAAVAPPAPFGGVRAQGAGGAIETGTKLYISNLDYGVSNEDIKELFSEIGELKRCAIHYDRSGRSKGTAEVVFGKKADALAAMSRYNNVQLDGKPMKIEVIGSNVAPVASTPAVTTIPQFVQPMVPVAVNPMAFVGRTGGRGGRGRGRGRGRGKGRGRSTGQDKTAEELDAELDTYKSGKGDGQEQMES